MFDITEVTGDKKDLILVKVVRLNGKKIFTSICCSFIRACGMDPLEDHTERKCLLMFAE